MLFFDRRKKKDRRSGSERRKDRESKYEGTQRRKGKERRSKKERRSIKDRRSGVYYGLPDEKKDALNNIMEFLTTEEPKDTHKYTVKLREDRYICKDSEFTHVQLRIGKAPEKPKLYSLKVKDCSEGGLGILIKKKDIDLVNRLRVGDVLQNVLFYSAWAEINLDAVITHKTKIEEGENKGSYLVGLKSEDAIKNYKPAT